MKRNSFLVGTNVYPSKGDASRRMCNAFDTWRNLNVPLINLAFADLPSCNPAGFDEVQCLERDSNTITGCEGVRKPLANDLFDGLCRIAKERNIDYFVYSNLDIQLTPKFGQVVSSTDLDSLVFTRLDFTTSPTSDDAKMLRYGQDTYAVRTDWWMENRHRIRPYIIGECVWDNVYTSIFARKGRSAHIYSKEMCHHEWHEAFWNPASDFGLYNERLKFRYDYLDYAMLGLYLRKIIAADKKDPNFPVFQKQLWESFCKEKPPLWLRTKSTAAIPLSFLVRRRLHSRRKKR